MGPSYQSSLQWENISKHWVTEDVSAELADFKSGRPNHKIAIWNPEANGIRYLKTLVYNLASGLGPAEWEKLRRIRNREVGDPFTVTYDGESVCLDYLQAVLELGFVEKGLDLAGAAVLEIGAGYGRTCHTLLSNHDLASYHIVDLPNTLGLCRSYLRAVLDEERFDRITFVTVDEVEDALGARRFDLAVNINSFTEMPPGTVRDYLALIDRRCDAFYVKNPVGKYMDKSLDGHTQGDEVVRMAMETGPLRKVVDINDSRAVEAAVPDFIEAYRPGGAWTCAADGWPVPWTYFWQALYRRSPAANGSAPAAGR
ncbi:MULTISPECIES: putative sugar O-methyltransferase [Actinomadura]|uniref:Sugar O-methyltransferase n=1 Tax=Actinomadura yumaensis TaxID=111807 RepID=A0ABW2CLQ5_9ACTN|nr:putative sugar O-methyltransferase [Actinomadura sp. J1-007]MWK40663.1 putative sugar O-methyltransferase [Actinomadura sp. J1-007]QFU19818.1 sugar O-methyltransferase [Actinomadura sp.]